MLSKRVFSTISYKIKIYVKLEMWVVITIFCFAFAVFFLCREFIYITNLFQQKVSFIISQIDNIVYIITFICHLYKYFLQL